MGVDRVVRPRFDREKTDVQTRDGKAQAYTTLSALLGGDERKIKLVLGVFHQSVRKDLAAMERAVIESDWSRVRKLVQRMAVGCRQIGEDGMADVLVKQGAVAIEHARYEVPADPNVFGCFFAYARNELVAVLDRSAAYAALTDLDSVA